MPYAWSDTPSGPVVLSLTAHRSLSPQGFRNMILITAGMMALPLLGLLGTAQLWWMLPFLAVGLWMLWFALKRSYKDGHVREQLTREGDELTLMHQPARGKPSTWQCNIYWAKAELHASSGPVPQYITLTGNGRTVELGSFLSEEERVILFKELIRYLGDPRQETQGETLG